MWLISKNYYYYYYYYYFECVWDQVSPTVKCVIHFLFKDLPFQ